MTPAGAVQDPAGKGVWAVAFSPDGAMLATGDYAHVVNVWDVPITGSSPARSFTAPGLSSVVTPVAFSADGSTLAAAGQTGITQDTVYLWKLAGGAPATAIEPGTVWGLAFSPAGTLGRGRQRWQRLSLRPRHWPADGAGRHRAEGPGGRRGGVQPGRPSHRRGDSAGPTFLWRTGAR